MNIFLYDRPQEHLVAEKKFSYKTKRSLIKSVGGTHDDKDRQVLLDTLDEMAELFEVEIWEQSTPRHSTDADPFQANRYKAFYPVFTFLLDQFDQMLGNLTGS